MSEEEMNYVEITDEDGNVTKCEVYDIVDFEGKTYATLLPLDEDDNPEEDAELILMECDEEGEDYYFKSIENEEEFDKVCEYIENLEYEDDEEAE